MSKPAQTVVPDRLLENRLPEAGDMAVVHEQSGALNPKMRNVEGYLPKELGEYMTPSMKAAFKLSADDGMKRLLTPAESLSKEYPDAAANLPEGDLASRFALCGNSIPEG